MAGATGAERQPAALVHEQVLLQLGRELALVQWEINRDLAVDDQLHLGQRELGARFGSDLQLARAADLDDLAESPPIESQLEHRAIRDERAARLESRDP